MPARMIGAVRSMFTAGVVKDALLPAISLTTTAASSPVPLPVMTTGFGKLVDATPEVESLALKGNSTSPVFHPEEFGGEGEPKVSCGAVASRFTVTEREAVPPPEVAVHVNATPAVSVVTEVAAQPLLELTLDSVSVTVQLTC